MTSPNQRVRFNKCIGAVSIIVQHPKRNGMILGLMHSERNALELPGGKIEPGEDIVTAAIRETFEETGLRVHVLDVESFIGVSEWQNHIVATVLAKMNNPDALPSHSLPDGSLYPTREGTPIWKYPVQFAAGNFWDYNQKVFTHYGMFD